MAGGLPQNFSSICFYHKVCMFMLGLSSTTCGLNTQGLSVNEKSGSQLTWAGVVFPQSCQEPGFSQLPSVHSLKCGPCTNTPEWLLIVQPSHWNFSQNERRKGGKTVQASLFKDTSWKWNMPWLLKSSARAVNWWMDKYSVVDPYGGIWFSH